MQNYCCFYTFINDQTLLLTPSSPHHLCLTLLSFPPTPSLSNTNSHLQMSEINRKSPKHCAKQGLNLNKIFKRFFYALFTFLLSLLALAILIWFILRPSKPEFSLKETDIYQLNLTAPHVLNSSIQVTLVTKNPNQKVGVYYDQLQAYATYRGEQITMGSSLPPFYQGHEDSNVLSASLMGSWVPVSPSFGYQVGGDQLTGKMVLGFKLTGLLRWKVGSWVSGRYRFNVDCVALLPFGPNAASGPLTSKQGSQCSTSL